MKALDSAALAALAGLLVCVAATAQTEKVSAPFRYSGYSQREWGGFARTSHIVEMRDGTRLTVDVLLPSNYTGATAAPTRFPAILRYTPYGRTFLKPGTEEIIVQDRLKYFLGYGYAVVSADMRGTGGSEGWNNRMSRALREDGKQIVDWIAAQSWSIGKVGMIGGSYEGWSQLAVASTRPVALKAITPLNASWDAFPGHPGGILSYSFSQIWSAFTYSLNHGRVFAPVPSYFPVPPPLDEDGDGLLSDEIPVDLNGNGWLHDDYRWPLDRGPSPRYADGVPRTRHLYLSSLMRHHAHPGGAPGTFDGFSTVSGAQFRDTPRAGDGLTAPDLNWAWFDDIRKSDVAILQLGGWFDPYVRSGIEVFTTLSETKQNARARLVVSPAYHQGITPAFAAFLGAAPVADIRIEQLRWYDRWLKDIDNGIDREQPVHFFVAHAGWRTEPRWPLAAAPTRFYLDEAARLADTQPRKAGKDEYRADFTHHSSWNPALDTTPIAQVNEVIGRPAPVSQTFLRNRQIMYGLPEGPPVRTQLDRKALVYTSAPLQRDTDVIGHPLVHVSVSSTAADGDFFFYLEDVDPAGEAVLVTEYQHRAGFARLRNNDELIPGKYGIDVKPDLPWHGFNRADYDPKALSNGKVVEIVTSLYPTAWRFRKGHSIRLSIAAADWPTFELHPALSPRNLPNAPDNIVPMISIHRGGARSSFVELPMASQGKP